MMRWQRPVAEESALTRLIADTEEQTRFKLNSVNRLRNTILYAEKVRQEWEAKALALGTDHSSAAGGGLFDSPQLQPIDFQDSNNRSLEPLDLSTSLQRSTSSRLDISSPRMSPDNPALVLSPRIPSGVPSSRTKASSIKDYTILKPISKGACTCSRLLLWLCRFSLMGPSSYGQSDRSILLERLQRATTMLSRFSRKVT